MEATYAIVPKTIIDACDNACVRLYAYLDEIQRANTDPHDWRIGRGTRQIAAHLGWHKDSVIEHARHLEHAGVVKIIERPGAKTRYVIIDNPARNRGVASGIATPDPAVLEATHPAVLEATPRRQGRPPAQLVGNERATADVLPARVDGRCPECGLTFPCGCAF